MTSFLCFIFLHLSVFYCVHSLPCPNSTWIYSPIAGKCYFRIDLTNNVRMNYTDAQRTCSNIGGNLVELLTEQDQLGFFNYAFNTLGFIDRCWTAASWNGSHLTWAINNTIVGETFFNSTVGALQNGNCSYFQTLVGHTNYWTYKISIVRTSCASLQPILCEYPVQKCDPTAITNFEATTMRMKNITKFSATTFYNLHHPQLLLNVECKPGYFRYRDSPTYAIPTNPPVNSLPVNTAYCENNSVYRAGEIEICRQVTCDTNIITNEIKIPHVEPYTQNLNRTFLFDTYFDVKCERGYVSYRNSSSTNSVMICGQHLADKTKGEWLPPDLNTCLPVTCPPLFDVMNPISSAYKAINRIDKKEYGEFQISSFPRYPNRVHIKCSKTGYFFEDRQFDKTIVCDLKNGSLISGIWQGTLGTELDRLKNLACVPVSCLSEDLIPRNNEGNQQLLTLKYQSNVTILEGQYGNRKVVALEVVNEPLSYSYDTLLQFECIPGSDTGLGKPYVLCKNDGKWNVTKLPGCTKLSEDLVLSGGKKHYVPPAKEAASAGSVGAVTIVIVIIFSVCIVILDLSTLSRDIVLLRRNIRRLKAYYKYKEDKRLKELEAEE